MQGLLDRSEFHGGTEMAKPEVEALGELIVRVLRDPSIQSCDSTLSSTAQHKMAERWRELARGGNWQALAKEIIADCVDEVVFHLLHALDEGLLPFGIEDVAGWKRLSEFGEGELAGWYMASPGWRTQYSSERVNDDLMGISLSDIGL
jgi:hypothetical protein